MKTSFLVLLLVLSFTASAQWISWRHEEDLNDNCDLQEVAYPSVDITGKASNDFARLNFIYNKKGFYLGTLIDRRSRECEPRGFILVGEDIDSNLLRAVKSDHRKKTFRFNDAYFDTKDTPPDQLVLDFAKQIPFILEVSGVNARENQSVRARYRYAREQATGAMDYRMHLASSKAFLLLDGTLYNAFDAGNFIWGAGMRRLGFSYLEVKLGSELNGALNTRSQNEQGNGIILLGDSRKDQRAIKAGYNSYYAKVDFQKYLAQVRQSALIDPSDFAMLKKLFLDKMELQSDVETILSLFKYKNVTEKDLIELSSQLAFLRWKDYTQSQKVAILEALIKAPQAGETLLENCRNQILKSSFDSATTTRLLDLM